MLSKKIITVNRSLLFILHGHFDINFFVGCWSGCRWVSGCGCCGKSSGCCCGGCGNSSGCTGRSWCSWNRVVWKARINSAINICLNFRRPTKPLVTRMTCFIVKLINFAEFFQSPSCLIVIRTGHQWQTAQEHKVKKLHFC